VTFAVAGADIVALTAFLQVADSVVTFFCRHASASLPPGETSEQCDVKSDRQADFIALC
jgi:hypothetical protein